MAFETDETATCSQLRKHWIYWKPMQR